MNDVQRWLMHELYGPGGFSRAAPARGDFRGGADQISQRRMDPQRIAQFKREALENFRSASQRERLMYRSRRRPKYPLKTRANVGRVRGFG